MDPDILPAAKLALHEIQMQLAELGLEKVQLREFKSGSVASKVQDRIRTKDKEMLSKLNVAPHISAPYQ